MSTTIPSRGTAAMTEPAAQAEPTAVEYTQEIRFAVVLYGGVSLAIYMNGIAQELLHLVRATAPGTDDGAGGGQRARDSWSARIARDSNDETI